MHYDKDYSKIEPTQKVAKAMSDIKEYLGEDRFNSVNEILKDEVKKGMDFNSLKHNLGLFVGIEGYPVKAWAEVLGIVVPE